MVEVVYYAASSLDGYIATADGGVEWLDPYHASDYGFAEFHASVDGAVMGSATYEVSLRMPPQPAGKPTWVFTGRDLPVRNAKILLTDRPPGEVMEEIEARGMKRIWLMGGGKLASSFVDAELLTHVDLFVVPVLLGGGLPLFAPTRRGLELKLREISEHKGGVVRLQYTR